MYTVHQGGPTSPKRVLLRKVTYPISPVMLPDPLSYSNILCLFRINQHPISWLLSFTSWFFSDAGKLPCGRRTLRTIEIHNIVSQLQQSYSIKKNTEQMLILIKNGTHFIGRVPVKHWTKEITFQMWKANSSQQWWSRDMCFMLTDH